MANTRTFSTASAATAASAVSAAATTTARTTLSPNRPRLRAVDRDEVADLTDVVGFLPPGATWLPAPQHTLPVLPGRPPMVGYLVLVPADQQLALAGAVATAQDRQLVPEPPPRPRRAVPYGSTRPGAPPPWTVSCSTSRTSSSSCWPTWWRTRTGCTPVISW